LRAALQEIIDALISFYLIDLLFVMIRRLQDPLQVAITKASEFVKLS